MMLSGRVALVTGASSGIGRATARALARAGADVAAAGRRSDRLTELTSEIDHLGQRAATFEGDVTDEPFARGLVSQTVQALGRLDILVNSAGILQRSAFEASSAEEWRQVMDVNFFGSFHTCLAAYQHMLAAGGGDIVNVSSTAGRRVPNGEGGAYAASKFALTGMTEAIRQSGGANDVRVSIIEPGATRTEVFAGITDAASREAIRQHVEKPGAMQPEDIAEAIVFMVALPRRTCITQLMIRPTIYARP